MNDGSADSGAIGANDAQSQNDSGMINVSDTGNMAAADTGATGRTDGGHTPSLDAGFAMDAMAMNSVCPPAGPYGSQEGDVTPNLMLRDCDGNAFNLHDVCSLKATWMFAFPGW